VEDYRTAATWFCIASSLCTYAALSVQPVAAWPAKLYPDAAIYLYGKGSFFFSSTNRYRPTFPSISSSIVIHCFLCIPPTFTHRLSLVTLPLHQMNVLVYVRCVSASFPLPCRARTALSSNPQFLSPSHLQQHSQPRFIGSSFHMRVT